MTNRRQRRRERAERRQPQPPQRSTRLPYLLIGGVVLVVAAVAVIVFAALSGDSGADPVTPAAAQDEATPVAAQGAAADASEPTPAPAQDDAAATVPLVTLEEFGDFQCSHCAQFALGMGRQLKKDFVDKGRINFVFRHFPFIGEESFRAAEATECARDQGRFWEYHDTVFENWNGVNKGAYSDDNLKGFATSLQLDRDAFDSCLDGGKYRGRVEEDFQLGERMGVDSTPSLFLQGRRIRVADYSELAGLIESAIAVAQ